MPMKTLGEYLDENACEKSLKELILLIAAQSIPVRDAFLFNRGLSAGKNVYGEKQAEMDVWADEHFTEVMRKSGLVKELASEEGNEVLAFPDARTNYAVVMDPLDGSSLINVNLTVGSIFGVFEGGVLQSGKNLKAAFFMLYGPTNTLTLSVGKGTHVFGMTDGGEFIRLAADMKIPEGKTYGTGGTKNTWVDSHDKCMDYIIGNDFKIRYTGAAVADIQQILYNGGLYAYPATKDKPDGKIRLLFESVPLAFIIQQAGGLGSDGKGDILEVEPKSIKHRTPIYMGSKGIVEKMQQIIGDA